MVIDSLVRFRVRVREKDLFFEFDGHFWILMSFSNFYIIFEFESWCRFWFRTPFFWITRHIHTCPFKIKLLIVSPEIGYRLSKFGQSLAALSHFWVFSANYTKTSWYKWNSDDITLVLKCCVLPCINFTAYFHLRTHSYLTYLLLQCGS